MVWWTEVGGVDGCRGRGEGGRAGEGGEERERNFFFFFTVPNFPSILTENLTEVPFRTNG